MAGWKTHHAVRLRALIALSFAVGFLGLIFIPGIASDRTPEQVAPKPTPRAQVTPPTARQNKASRSDFREFPHDIDAHKKDCASCHTFPSANWDKVRKADAFEDVTDYPKHQSCVECHRQQFFKGARPNICTICHTDVSPRNSTRHPFPNPREIFDLSPKGKAAGESDFKVGFPHEKHMALLGLADPPEAEQVSGPAAANPDFATRSRQDANVCATCHTTLNPQGDSPDEYYTKPPTGLGDGFWLKRGTFKSNPLGHTQCFTCHSVESGLPPTPTDCATCHQFKEKAPPMDVTPSLIGTMKVEDRVTILTWRRRSSSAKFQHEFFAHSEISCSSCHNTDVMNTATVAGRRVKIQSCGGEGVGCHVTPTLDDGGILNFEIDERSKNPRFECSKCHMEFGRQAVPLSHIEALKAFGEKK